MHSDLKIGGTDPLPSATDMYPDAGIFAVAAKETLRWAIARAVRVICEPVLERVETVAQVQNITVATVKSNIALHAFNQLRETTDVTIRQILQQVAQSTKVILGALLRE